MSSTKMLPMPSRYRGKVAVYTGILQYTQTETGLAVVLGHEVAHALARHGGERMSRSMIAQLGLTAVQTGLNTNNPTIVQGIALAYGVGVELPFDRGQESEADHIGLILMAKAGYDPRQAIPFWEQMSSANQSKGAPEFLSTHPSGDTRIKQLRQWMPEALQYYSGREILRGKRDELLVACISGYSVRWTQPWATHRRGWGTNNTAGRALLLTIRSLLQPQRQGQPLTIQATMSSPAGIHKAEVFCRQAGGEIFPRLKMEHTGQAADRAVVPDWMTAGAGSGI